MSWEVIIPFLRPIELLIRDPEISDIMINGPDHVFIEKFGEMRRVPGVSLSEKALQVAIRNIARRLGDDISEAKPILDARLPGRVAPDGGHRALCGQRHNIGHPEVPKPALWARRSRPHRNAYARIATAAQDCC